MICWANYPSSLPPSPPPPFAFRFARACLQLTIGPGLPPSLYVYTVTGEENGIAHYTADMRNATHSFSQVNPPQNGLWDRLRETLGLSRGAMPLRSRWLFMAVGQRTHNNN